VPHATRGRAVSRRRSDDLDAWIVLAFAGAFAAVLILVESRSNTFFNDEIAIFQQFGQGIDAQSILEPHNGHLIVPAHLAYAATFTWIGPSYTVLRVIGVLVLLGCCGLFFLLAKERVGTTTALAPTLVLLFLGSSWEALLWPLTMLTFGLSIAFGLGALLAIQRGDLKGDVAACALVSLAVISHSTGLAFLVGVGVALLIGGGAKRRAWVFAVPLAIYAAWWVWALRFHEGLAHPGNLLIVPEFMADSLAAVCAAITGLGLKLISQPTTLSVSLDWGRPLAALVLGAIVWSFARRGLRRIPWIELAILLAYWLELAIGFGPGRGPAESRYLFGGALLLLLVATSAFGDTRFSPRVLAVVFAVTGVSLLLNVKQLDNAEGFLRDYSQRARAALTAMEVARNTASSGFHPGRVSQLDGLVPNEFPATQDTYIDAVDRFGSFAFSPNDLLHQSSAVRAEADVVLASAERLSLRPAPDARAPGRCSEVTGGRQVTELPPGAVRVESDEPAEVRLGRFADTYPVKLGRLTPRTAVILSIPSDAERRPWRVVIGGHARARICAASQG
jgi:hypothetical protein